MAKKVILTLTVDWEGATIKDENLKAMRELNDEFPTYPITHFICPAYFTRGGVRESITRQIKSVIKPIDEIALHVHCWYTLMDHCVRYHLTAPTWEPGDGLGIGVKYDHDQRTDYGHPVPLGLYTAEEIRDTLIKARQLLVDNGLIGSAAECEGFRCGGWMACDKVFGALEAAGFQHDASGAPSSFSVVIWERVLQRFGVRFPLFDWLALMWGPSFMTEPDFLVNLRSRAAYPRGVLGIGDPAISGPAQIGSITEVPDTGSLADYTTLADLELYIDTAVGSLADEVYISMGFHQETAARTSAFAPPSTNIQILTQALEYLQSVTDPVVMTRRDCARHFRARQEAALRAKPLQLAA
jgi:hypothetical protein